MVIDSTLKCVHTYHTPVGEVNIIPGRNLIRDDVGRALMKSDGFNSMLKTKAIGFQNAIQITIPPAADPALAKAKPGGKTPVTPPDGETAVSNMLVPDAVALINECGIVDQLQDIMTRDPRAGVKRAAEARIAALAAEALRDDEANNKEDDAEDDADAN